MTRRFTLLLALVLLALFLVGGFALERRFLAPVAPEKPVTIEVESGDSLAAVAQRLAAEGVVRSPWSLRLLARLRGEGGRMQTGRYAFVERAGPAEILERLISGDVIQVRVTIPEGWTLREIAARLAEEDLAPEAKILALARDPDFARQLGIEADSLEGYLFPDTYLVPAGMPAGGILAVMVRELRRHLTPELVAAARRQGLDDHQLLTLASIVQKEAGNQEEMPLIAAVFHNRLHRRMPLQADPTVIYGIPDFDGNLTREDLARKTPYNTYRIRGLPPGPIASPGDAALQAAAHPAPVDYLYFVARGDGTHRFSSTLAEHNRAVRRYQLRR